MGGAGEETGEDTPRVGQRGGGDCQRLVRWRRLPTMKALFTVLCLSALSWPPLAFAAELAKSESKEIKELRGKAEKGDAQAEFALALNFGLGQNTTQDLQEALKWVRASASHGNPEAQNFLGVMHEAGNSVPQDYKVAFGYFQSAAQGGFTPAMFNLGRLLKLGKGVAKDELAANKWFDLAAEKGDAMAQNLLGLHSAGRGDFAIAIKWFHKAAAQGFPQAQVELGELFASGSGVKQNYEESARWLRKAANQGDATAQGRMAYFCYMGHGVAQDYVEACKWFNLLAAKGDTNAALVRNNLNKRMTPDQVAEGQRRAAAFVAREEGVTNAIFDFVPADGLPKVTGTGFFITDDGYFITNQHVAGEGATVRILTAAGSIAAKVVKVDKANDVALLKAEGKFTALPVITSRGVRLGATAATVGFPNTGLQGFAPKLAKGEIASLAGAQDDARHFQISAPIQPGNSGGALVDERGNVIGVVVAKLSQKAALATSGALAENVNYAVKSSYLLSFLESVPEVAAKLKEAHTKERKFEDVVKSVEQATVLVLVY